MVTHIESDIWALGQHKDRDQPHNQPSGKETTPSKTVGRARERHVSARRPDRTIPNGG